MKIHVEVHQRSERYICYIYWIINLPMLLNTIKKGFAHKNINTHNTSDIGLIVKITYKHVSCLD